MSTSAFNLRKFSINGNEIDPNDPRFRAVDAARTNYIILQPRYPLSKIEVDELKRLKVEIQLTVATGTLLCKYEPADIEAVRQLPFLQYVDVYRNLCVIDPELRQGLLPTPTEPSSLVSAQLPPTSVGQPSREPRSIQIDIVLHDDIELTSDAILSKISSAANVPESSFKVTPYLIQGHVPSDRLEILAKLDEVSRIEEVLPMGTNDVYAERILRSNVNINNTQFTGEGQIVAVADTGFDNGTITDCHEGFKGKVLKLFSIWRKDQANDTVNHGTHVCGSIVAEGESSVTGERIRGTAPQAKLIVQSLCSPDAGIKRPDNLIQLLDTAHIENGASVHTNSWGPTWSDSKGQPDYTQECFILDEYARNHPDLVICWAAGNDGEHHSKSKGQIGVYAASKNVITVGATVSDRPFDPQLSDEPGRDAAIQQGTDVNVVAYNSSRGPILRSRRIKPDVVAPGVRILSATSQDSEVAKMKSKLHIQGSRAPDKLWETLSGTSMATPQVAGCVAVLKQILLKHGFGKPSADVIKALLVNGAVSLKNAPNNDEGFGRVNLENSIIIPGVTPYSGISTHPGLTTGEKFSFQIDIPSFAQLTRSSLNDQFSKSDGVILNATLVWSDFRGKPLVNQLNFIITASNRKECHGNKHPGESGFDTVNNVQKIVWKGVPAGSAQVTVTAHNVPTPQDKQPCAVVWRITSLGGTNYDPLTAKI